MASERKLTVVIAGDTKGLNTALDKAQGKAEGFGSKLGALSGKAKVALAGAAAGAGVLAKQSIDSASDLAETLSKSNTVFGDQGKAIEKWADSAATNIGQSKQQALEAASTFGNLFVQLGIGSEKAAGMSTQMATLASDFASFHNADISEVIEAQSAAFRGEYDALQKFVPTINAAAVEQKALALTGKKTTKELTAQDKALATQALMMEGAGDAAGDFARTSDGLANKQRILSAKFGDLQAKVGTALIPVMLKLTEVGMGIISFVSNLSPEMKTAIGVLAAAGAAVFLVVKAVKAWQAAQLALNVVLTANPIGLIIAAVAAFVAGIVIAYQKVDWFRAIVDKSFALIKTAIVTVFNWVKTNWPLLLAILTGPIGLAVLAISKHWDTIKAGAAAVKDWVVARFGDLVGFFSRLPGAIASALGSVAEAFTAPFRSAFGAIKRLWNSTVGGFGFSIPSWVPGVGGKKFSIPEMHTGGIFDSGRGEGLALLRDGEGVFTRDQMAAMGGGSGSSVVIDLRGAYILSELELERAIEKGIRGTLGRNGRIAGTNIERRSA